MTVTVRMIGIKTNNRFALESTRKPWKNSRFFFTQTQAVEYLFSILKMKEMKNRTPENATHRKASLETASESMGLPVSPLIQ